MATVHHRYRTLDGVDLFYREAGRSGAPTVLLLHGFPSSSIQFRCMLRDLSDECHLVAPDLPGFGFTRVSDPTRYRFTFDGLATTIAGFIRALGLDVFAVYLHDYGAQTGFRLLTRRVIEPRAIIIQNAEAFHGIGWREPMRGIERRDRTKVKTDLLNADGIRKEFIEDLPVDLAERIDPAVIELGWRKINEPGMLDAMLDLHMDYGSNIEHYPRVQAYLRETARPTLVLWGERDQYVSADGARAYAGNAPNVDVKLLDGGHWLLETHPTDVNAAVRSFI